MAAQGAGPGGGRAPVCMGTGLCPASLRSDDSTYCGPGNPGFVWARKRQDRAGQREAGWSWQARGWTPRIEGYCAAGSRSPRRGRREKGLERLWVCSLLGLRRGTWTGQGWGAGTPAPRGTGTLARGAPRKATSSLICVPFQAVVRAQSLVKRCRQGWKGECGLGSLLLGDAWAQSSQGPAPAWASLLLAP